MDGEESAEGGLLGKIISGFVRVGDVGAIETRECSRTCMLKGYGALTVFEQFAFFMHANKRIHTFQTLSSWVEKQSSSWPKSPNFPIPRRPD